MEAFLTTPPDRKRVMLTEAEERLGLSARSIEKDFWVSWMLRELFALPALGSRLTFKGGTSLAKCWKLIDRFSEDLDLVIDRELLGFPGEKLGSKQLEKLREACRKRVRDDLLPALEGRLRERLGGAGPWRLEMAGADEDPDLQTILFSYPSVFKAPGGYVRPVVKLEFGTRSDVEPVEVPRVQAMLADAFPGVFGDPFGIRTVAARRTFWEKAMLLHEETSRTPGKARKPRMARHYYDVWSLIERGVAAQAVADSGLLERIVAHRRVFFRQSWADYDTMVKGRLRMLPMPEQESAWRTDYAAMRRDMFFREPPTFDAVLATVGRFETDFNRT